MSTNLTQAAPLLFPKISGQNGIVSVKDHPYNAKGDGSSDDTSAINAALAAAVAANRALYFPPGDYVTGPINRVTKPYGMRIFGAHHYDTRIKFVPTADNQVLFDFARPDPSADQQNTVVLEDMAIYTSDTTYTKTAIRSRNGSRTNIQRIRIYGTAVGQAWKGGDSVGIQVAGREQVILKNLSVTASVPLYLTENPSEVGGSYDMDHLSVENFYGFARSDAVPATLPHAVVLIGDDVRISTSQFYGHQAWIGGEYGLYWNNSGSASASGVLRITGLLTEQGVSTDGWSIWINGGSSEGLGLRNLCVEGSLDITRKGIKTARVNNVEYRGSCEIVAAGRTALEIEKGTSLRVNWNIPTTMPNDAIVFPDGDYKLAYGTSNYGSGRPYPIEAIWRRVTTTANNVPPDVQIGDASVVSVSGTVANNGTVNLPLSYSLRGNRVGMLEIVATSIDRVAFVDDDVEPSTDAITSVAHTFVANQPVKFWNSGGALPAGLSSSTTYYVRDVTADTFKVSTTPGGAAEDITDVGTGTHYCAGTYMASGVFVMGANASGTNGLTRMSNAGNMVVGTGSAGEVGISVSSNGLTADVRINNKSGETLRYFVVGKYNRAGLGTQG